MVSQLIHFPSSSDDSSLSMIWKKWLVFQHSFASRYPKRVSDHATWPAKPVLYGGTALRIRRTNLLPRLTWEAKQDRDRGWSNSAIAHGCHGCRPNWPWLSFIDPFVSNLVQHIIPAGLICMHVKIEPKSIGHDYGIRPVQEQPPGGFAALDLLRE